MALYGRAVLTSQLKRSSPWGVNSFCFSPPVLFHKENKSLHSPLKRTLRGYDHRLWTAIFAAKCCLCLVNKLPSQNDEATKSEPELFRPFVGMTSHVYMEYVFKFPRGIFTEGSYCSQTLLNKPWSFPFFQDYVCRYFR